MGSQSLGSWRYQSILAPCQRAKHHLRRLHHPLRSCQCSSWFVAPLGLHQTSLTRCAEFQIPPQVARYASFMFSFIGRGVFYIFVGGLCFSDNILKYLVGGVIILVGIAYVVLEYVPSIEPPANMR